ncbi:MAG: hypothetical protein ACT4TC_23055 [Myxococcaceae bacterium]
MRCRTAIFSSLLLLLAGAALQFYWPSAEQSPVAVVAERKPAPVPERLIEPELSKDAGRPAPQPLIAAPKPRHELDPRKHPVPSDARCSAETARDAGAVRAELLTRFKRMESRGFTIDFDPLVTPEFPLAVLDALSDAEREAVRLLGHLPEVRNPYVVLYKDANQMRSASCVRIESALGHYDGTIHLSSDDQNGIKSLRETILHEYIHHALNELDVESPTWLQEGLAILASGEARPHAQVTPVDLHSLDRVLTTSTDPRELSAAYLQSLSRVEFLQANLRGGTLGALVRDNPARAFPPELETAWRKSLKQ